MSETPITADEESNGNYDQWSGVASTGIRHELSQGDLPSPEQKERELSFDRMAALSLEEYLELWKRLNPFYVTHITRQGVRDHVGMIYHTAGHREFHDGFRLILKDGKTLRSPAEINYGLPPNFTEDDVARVIDRIIDTTEPPGYYDDMTPEQIVNNLPFNFTFATADPWADKQAIHFTQNVVLDSLYGGEAGNEVFFIFPTDVIASQCQFGGHIAGGLATPQADPNSKWNDLFAWPKDGEIPIDAGIVFLPKSQMVDRNTGSRYSMREVLSETGEPILVPEKDEERISDFKKWLDGVSEKDEGNLASLEQELEKIGIPKHCIKDFLDFGHFGAIILYKEFGYFGNVSEEQLSRMTPDEISDYSIRKYLSDVAADLKYAEDPITAQEYWEHYFDEHPDQRPAHIVYYDGDDPSVAVDAFLESHGIKRLRHSYRDDEKQIITGPGDSSKRDGQMLGFDSHFIGSGRNDERLASEHQRFNELALKVLTERQEQSEQ